MTDKMPPTAIKKAPAHIQDTNGFEYILKDFKSYKTLLKASKDKFIRENKN